MRWVPSDTVQLAAVSFAVSKGSQLPPGAWLTWYWFLRWLLVFVADPEPSLLPRTASLGWLWWFPTEEVSLSCSSSGWWFIWRCSIILVVHPILRVSSSLLCLGYKLTKVWAFPPSCFLFHGKKNGLFLGFLAFLTLDSSFPTCKARIIPQTRTSKPGHWGRQQHPTPLGQRFFIFPVFPFIKWNFPLDSDPRRSIVRCSCIAVGLCFHAIFYYCVPP